MKYFSRMLGATLENQGWVDNEEKSQIVLEFDESFQVSKETKNVFVTIVNTFFMHPVGVMVAIFLYAKMNRALNLLTMSEEVEDANSALKAQIMKKISDDIVDGF